MNPPPSNPAPSAAIDLARIARLARLRVSDARVTALSADMARIVAQFQSLRDAPAGPVEREGPRASGAVGMDSLRPDRRDIATSDVSREAIRNAILENAVALDHDSFVVPRVIE